MHESVTRTSIDMLTLTQVSDSEVERFFATLDVNNDGEVSRQEFMSWHHGRFAAAAQEEELVLEQLQNLALVSPPTQSRRESGSPLKVTSRFSPQAISPLRHDRAASGLPAR